MYKLSIFVNISGGHPVYNDFGCMAAVGIVQKEDKTRESFARISLASKLELISQLWQGEIGLQCSSVTSVVEFEGAGPTVHSISSYKKRW